APAPRKHYVSRVTRAVCRASQSQDDATLGVCDAPRLLPSGWHVLGRWHRGVGGRDANRTGPSNIVFTLGHLPPWGGSRRARYGSCSSHGSDRPMGESNDSILVVDAGSSSMKLAVFAERGGELSRELRGAIDGLYTMPCFGAHDPTGRVIAEKSWGRTALGHDGAIEYLSEFLRHHLASHRLVGVG